jgi:hypothetical protein
LDFCGKVLILKDGLRKVLILNEKELSDGAGSDFGPNLIVPVWVGEFSSWDVVCFVGFEGFWGLTCDFWAVFEEKILWSQATIWMLGRLFSGKVLKKAALTASRSESNRTQPYRVAAGAYGTFLLAHRPEAS